MLGNLIITLLLIAVAYFVFTRKQATSTSRTNTLVIYGLSDCGKTELFYRLLHNKTLPTTSSMEVNRGSLALSDRSLELIDVPGNTSFIIDLKKSLTPAAAVLFLIDLGRK